MSTETRGFTPTDEDVAVVAAEVNDPFSHIGFIAGITACERDARIILSTIGPIIERERRAAKAEVYHEFVRLLAADGINIGTMLNDHLRTAAEIEQTP